MARGACSTPLPVVRMRRFSSRMACLDASRPLACSSSLMRCSNWVSQSSFVSYVTL